MTRRESEKKPKMNYWDASGGNERAKRSFLVAELSTSYIHLVSAFCLACSLYYAVTRVPTQTVHFHEFVYVFLYVSGVGVLSYLLVFIRNNLNRTLRRDRSTVSIENIGLRYSKEDNGRSAIVEVPRISYAGEGFNYYLRAGLLGFNIFSCVYNLIRVITEISDDFEKCGHVGVILLCILQGVFFTFQTVFIFLNHKIIFLTNKPVIRLCLSHLLIVNICSWIYSGLGEVSEGVAEVFEKEQELERRLRHEKNNETRCDNPTSAVALVRPYLKPALIEYALLAIPMMLELLWRVGNMEEVLKDEGELEDESEKAPEEEFPKLHKAKRGLIAGVLAFVLTIVSVLSFFLLTEEQKVIGLTIYHVEAFLLNVLATVFCALALHHLDKLRFLKKIEGRLDVMILRLALFGTFFYYVVIISNSIDALDPSASFVTQFFTGIEIILALVTLGSCCFQSFVIINGMHRAPAVRDHIVGKPGRPYITMLLCINLALWMIDTFQVKKSEMAFSVKNTRGSINIATSITLMHVALPMVILFRFHSTICLSSIWYKSYLLE